VTDRSRSEDLQALKEMTKAIEARHHLLNRRIREISTRPRTSFLKAVVDFESCVGCGICENQCPAGAIIVKKTAIIHRELCIGCGQCVYECPRAAISLCPVGPEDWRQA
jgi:NAD-dependent dihydropyrimidine dehydrogenase PreA subunit